MEVLNMACGGTLYLRLRQERPQALPHQGSGDGPHVHAVLLEPGSCIAVLYARGEVRVASAHDRAIRQPGAGLRATAWAADGVIEAVETDDPQWFCVGVQWQPRWQTDDGADRPLLAGFVEACRRARRAQAPAA
jgi:putative glutamine amidotransferase